MNPIPIQFFQAAATAIPTLLVAVMVTMKLGESYTGSKNVWGQLGNAVMAMLLALLTTGGEFLVLLALLKKEVTRGQLISTMVALILLGLLIVVYFLVPVVWDNPGKSSIVVRSVASVFVLGLAAYAFLVTMAYAINLFDVTNVLPVG